MSYAPHEREPAPELDPSQATEETTRPAKPKAAAKAKTATFKIGVAMGSPPALVYIDNKKGGANAPRGRGQPRFTHPEVDLG